VQQTVISARCACCNIAPFEEQNSYATQRTISRHASTRCTSANDDYIGLFYRHKLSKIYSKYKVTHKSQYFKIKAQKFHFKTHFSPKRNRATLRPKIFIGHLRLSNTKKMHKYISAQTINQRPAYQAISNEGYFARVKKSNTSPLKKQKNTCTNKTS
jgi:hypothetical protein